MTTIISQQQVSRRLRRLNSLSPDQIGAGLSFLAGFSPVIFDLMIDAARTWTDDAETYLARLRDPAPTPVA
jgi:hypothetical protein